MERRNLNRAGRYRYWIISQREANVNEWELEASCEEKWRAERMYANVVSWETYANVILIDHKKGETLECTLMRPHVQQPAC
jgi:hypothetical protein